MAAVPFGFSFGDFVAAIEVTHKAAQALRRSAGARDKIIQAAADLENFERVLRKVQTLIPSNVNPDTLAAIHLCAHTCQLPLGHFVQRIKDYERHMSQQHGSRPDFMYNIERGYWKIKWSFDVEEDVAKLKAAVGPGLATIDILLQVESLEKSTAVQLDLHHVMHLAQRTCSLAEHTHLTLQQQTMSANSRFDKLDSMAADTTTDLRKVLQQLPPLARHDQMRVLEPKLDQLSAAMDSRATADQVDHIESLFHNFFGTQARNHIESSTNALRSEHRLELVDQKVDEIRTHMTDVSATLSALYTSSTAPSSVPSNSTSTGVASCSDLCKTPCTRTRSLDTPLPSMLALFLDLLRKILCSVIILFAMLPNIQAQLRTCMTFIRSPLLLSENSIALTDALNRTKMLPYEYFHDWKLLEPWLQKTFAGFPGESRVLRGDFAMFKQYGNRTGPQIPVEQWERCVFAGDQVVMSMRVNADRAESKCRRCGVILPLAGTGDVWRKW